MRYSLLASGVEIFSGFPEILIVGCRDLDMLQARSIQYMTHLNGKVGKVTAVNPNPFDPDSSLLQQARFRIVADDVTEMVFPPESLVD